MTVGDDLLAWASETGCGSWSQLRDAAAYLSRVHNTGDRPWYVAVPLSDLGHIDLSWSREKWSVTPPALVLARACGLCLYLVGARPQRMIERFDEAADSLDVYPFEVPQGHAPRALFAKCASVDAGYRLADRLGVDFLLDPAGGLAQRLQVIDPSKLELASPSPVEESLERFDPDHFVWQPATDRERNGLYRIDLYGRNLHRLHLGNQWYRVDQAVGQLIVLRDKPPVIGWSPPTSDWSIPSALEVPSWLALPQLADRAAVASSGLLPVRSKGRRLYRNVSRVVAKTLAERLGIGLAIRTTPCADLISSSQGVDRG